MNGRALIGLLTFKLMTLSVFGTTDPLEQYEWRYRILLYDIEQSAITDFAATVHAQERELVERHMRLVGLSATFKSALHLNFSDAQLHTIRARLINEPKQPRLFLIGKDGGLKHVQDDLLLDSIFAKIDTMPMRRSEMRD